MSDIVPTTPPQDPALTGGDDTPAATQPKGSGGATDDEMITVKKSDYNKMISARDKANNQNSDVQDFMMTVQQEREETAKKEALTTFLQDHKDKYPDLTVDDLMTVDDPEKIEEAAQKAQRRLEDVVQKRLMDVQKFKAPELSPEERAEKEKQLKANPSKSSFGSMLKLRSSNS